ncbi:MAG: lysophospholipid acyltransferase family protein [Prevotella sp.]|nr:lysophospholipid acyltransferase family protein [Prevotella sp.]
MSKLVYYISYGLWWLLSLLPLRVHYIFSDIIYVLLYRVFHYRVKVVRSNMASAMPELDDSQRQEIERRFYHRLCDYFVETVKLMTMSRSEMKRRMVFKNIEDIDKCVAEGQSCAVYLGHTFNWEWVTSLPLWVTPKAQCGQIYHAMEDKNMDKLLLSVRQRFGAVCIPMAETLRRLTAYRRDGQPVVIGYISDQVPFWNNIHHWCQFLHHDTPVLTGTERIARSAGHAVFFADVRRVRRGYYEADMRLITREPKETSEYEITDIYFRELESAIRHQPELWLWTHKRWKRTREEFDRRFVVVDGKVLPREIAAERNNNVK